jgi:ParB-like chromosome segregation protein Spo0J
MLEAEPVLQEAFNIDDIERDESLQARAQLDPKTIDSYAEEMQRHVQFPPVEIFQDGARYYLADGWHRFKAALSIGAQVIRANVRPGTRRDAVLYAAGANITHGLRRSNADKRKAVTLLLYDEECRYWSDHELAKHAGVDHKTVGRIRKEQEESGEIPQIENRTVERGNQAYTMAKTKKSKKPEAPHTAPASDKDEVSQVSNTPAVDDALAETLSHPEVQDTAASAWQDTPSDPIGSETSERTQCPSAAETPLASEANVEQAEQPVPAGLKQRIVEVIKEYVQQYPDIAEAVVKETVEEALHDIHTWMDQRQGSQEESNV